MFSSRSIFVGDWIALIDRPKTPCFQPGTHTRKVEISHTYCQLSLISPASQYRVMALSRETQYLIAESKSCSTRSFRDYLLLISGRQFVVKSVLNLAGRLIEMSTQFLSYFKGTNKCFPKYKTGNQQPYMMPMLHLLSVVVILSCS